MKKQVKQKAIFLLLTLILVTIPQITSVVNAETAQSPWKMDFQIQGENKTSFVPFEQISLCANVTYENAAQPDVLVAFNVQGPLSSPINITRIVSTDSNGMAVFSFRIPVENQNGSSALGMWHATATIQTNSGTLQQKVNFTAQWDIEINSMSLLDSQGHEQTTFNLGDTITVELTVNNRGQTQATNITLNLLDSTDKLLNQNTKQDTTISQNSTKVQTEIKIPQNATEGAATINARIFSGTYDGEGIPAAEAKNASLTIGNAAMPTASPTATPLATATPTPTPAPFEMSFSLFSWLLIFTGFFTFTSLYVFLRRKQTPTGTTIPGLPPGMPITAIATTFTDQNPPPTNLASLPSLPGTESTGIQEQEAKTILTQLSKVSAAAKRIEELKAALKVEKEILTNELGDLNRTVEEQEKTVKSYFETLRREIEKSQAVLTDKMSQPSKKTPT